MARVEFLDILKEDILKKFRGNSKTIFVLMESVGDSPKKGKFLVKFGNIAIKELKYNSFRFYFLVDAFKIKFLSIDELKNLLIKFVRMSDKKSQQKVIEEIKDFLKKI